MALQPFGPISMGDINVELGKNRTTANTLLAGGSTPTPYSLFGQANGSINKDAPHKISEFYGYNHQNAYTYIISAEYGGQSSPNPSTACAISNDYEYGYAKQLYSLSGTLTIGMTLYTNASLTTLFVGNGEYYKSFDSYVSVKINSSGIVQDIYDCSTVPTVPINISLYFDDYVGAGKQNNVQFYLNDLTDYVSISGPTQYNYNQSYNLSFDLIVGHNYYMGINITEGHYSSYCWTDLFLYETGTMALNINSHNWSHGYDSGYDEMGFTIGSAQSGAYLTLNVSGYVDAYGSTDSGGW